MSNMPIKPAQRFFYMALAVFCFSVAGAILWHLIASADDGGTLGAMPQNAQERIGFAFDAHDPAVQNYPADSLSRYDLSALYGCNAPSGWYYDFGYRVDGAYEVGTLDYAIQMLWNIPHTVTLQAIIRNNPGDLMVIGNEPDVSGQSNMTPERYAQFYYDAWQRIRDISPDQQLGIAGVANGTPQRIAYLQSVLDSYRAQFGEEMPIDVWTIHLYHFEPSPLVAVESQVVGIRELMKSNGYQDRELWVTEMIGDADYMMAAFDWLLRAQSDSGLAIDDNRLVQRVGWFALNRYMDMPNYLYDKVTAQPSSMASAWRGFVESAGGDCVAGPVPTAPASELIYFPIVERQ